MEQTFVLIGAGQASSQAIDSLRKEGHTGRIVLVGDEPHLPYQRPPLSKKYLAGEMEPARLFVRPASFYETHRVELKLGVRATGLDCAARRVTLDDHTTLHYDQLLLATGSEPRRVKAHGHQLAGIHYLRGIDDVDRIRAEIQPGRRVVIVGAGYIGLEVAATCRKLGLEVDVLEMADRVMNRVVAPALSEFFAAEHASHGVRIHTATALAAFEGDERVRAVVTPDGRRFEADFVIVGVGVLPSDQLAASAGLACDNGIAVDGHCRTSDRHVYAIGDCCSHPSLHYQRRVRLESVDNAFEQAKTAAANMCGKTVLHDKVPWFWSDQYDLKLLIVGLNTAHDQVVLRGDLGSRSFSCCYLRNGELLALDCINNPKDYMAGRKLIESRARFDLARLADPGVALKDAVLA